MTRLIDDLLSLSRVEMRVHLSPRGTAISARLRATSARLSSRWRKRPISRSRSRIQRLVRACGGNARRSCRRCSTWCRTPSSTAGTAGTSASGWRTCRRGAGGAASRDRRHRRRVRHCTRASAAPHGAVLSCQRGLEPGEGRDGSWARDRQAHRRPPPRRAAHRFPRSGRDRPSRWCSTRSDARLG